MQKLRQVQSQIAKGKTDAAIAALNAFINEVQAQRGRHITPEAADVLIADALWVIEQLRASASLRAPRARAKRK